MSKRSIFFILLLVTFSCGPSDKKRESELAKERITGKIKEIVKSEFEACEKADFEMVMKPFFDSSDFIYIINGSTLNYQDFSEGIRNIFNSLQNLKITIVNERFTFTGDNMVLYTANCKILETFKDGTTSLNDPAAILFIFKRIDHNWQIIYGVQSYIKKTDHKMKG